ncbi:ureidoglycolate lyase [Jannaschia sp. CCS1]|uniref:ureidoglycolate lyase n=1 Tax=Jannaschia sp. (strain CCS1) TaxID=290400 RepID=UPI000053A3F0|nr:ureidoglycolate lyase [Jannaschia sp. CCS1]ABD57032.1 putative ureidoglycolate hydrolase [Jannaschia sp. CCS1]
MSHRAITLQPPDGAAFAPFGRLIHPPDAPGKRQFYSDALHIRPPGSAPVLHVNHVLPSPLPVEVTGIERHPHAAQCFMPIDVAGYAVLVFPSDASGQPLLDQGLGFLMPGTMGVIYAPTVWHLGATVLERPGHFSVLMWRGGPQQDDEFQSVPPLILAAPS